MQPQTCSTLGAMQASTAHTACGTDAEASTTYMWPARQAGCSTSCAAEYQYGCSQPQRSMHMLPIQLAHLHHVRLQGRQPARPSPACGIMVQYDSRERNAWTEQLNFWLPANSIAAQQDNCQYLHLCKFAGPEPRCACYLWLPESLQDQHCFTKRTCTSFVITLAYRLGRGCSKLTHRLQQRQRRQHT